MKIGIFTAMEKEAKSFIAEDCSVEKVGAYTFYKFMLGANEAVLCVPPTVGEIAAGAGVQMLADRFGVEAVFNFGVVGAMTLESSFYRMVYVDKVCHYAMDTSAIDECEQGYYPYFDGKYVYTDKHLLAKAQKALDLPVVTCASADKFVADKEEKRALAQTFGCEICDMESAAIAMVCAFNKLPCLLVKCVADTLYGGAEDYRTKMDTIMYDFLTVAKQICAADVD